MQILQKTTQEYFCVGKRGYKKVSGGNPGDYNVILKDVKRKMRQVAQLLFHKFQHL